MKHESKEMNTKMMVIKGSVVIKHDREDSLSADDTWTTPSVSTNTFV